VQREGVRARRHRETHHAGPSELDLDAAVARPGAANQADAGPPRLAGRVFQQQPQPQDVVLDQEEARGREDRFGPPVEAEHVGRVVT
jgi:hypothetical protein